jgi:hypothetical protein
MSDHNNLDIERQLAERPENRQVLGGCANVGYDKLCSIQTFLFIVKFAF